LQFVQELIHRDFQGFFIIENRRKSKWRDSVAPGKVGFGGQGRHSRRAGQKSDQRRDKQFHPVRHGA